MERKNPKQLWLDDEVAALAETIHLDYQSFTKKKMTFRKFGNMVMKEGLDMAALQMKVLKKHRKARKRRQING